MRAQLDQRVFVSIARKSNAEEPAEEHVHCSAHQIGGILLQPVPISEMERLCGLNIRGSRIIVDWPAQRRHHSRPGHGSADPGRAGCPQPGRDSGGQP